jgi:hypothetical protein
MNYTEIIGGLLGGGGIMAFFNFFRDSKKDRSEEIFKLLDEYKSMVLDLRKMEVECKSILKQHETQLNEMQGTISELRSQIILLESATNDLPFPMWLKDIESTMLYVNEEYENLFLKPMGLTTLDYMGKKDVDIWGEEIGKKYIESDKKTLAMKGKSYLTLDPIILNGNNLSEHWKIIKYLRFVGKVVVGIGGIAIPTFKTD